MLIKGTDSKRQAIPYEPYELVHAAIVRGLKEHGGSEWVYWSPQDGLKLSGPVTASKNPLDASWEATASGVCLIGKTKIATDQFYDAKRCSFTVAYKSAKDELGLPDIAVIGFDFHFEETNPAKTAGPMPAKAPAAQVLKGEMTPEASEQQKSETKSESPRKKSSS